MQVDFAFICDFADVSGKVTAFGIGFDSIFAVSTPCTHAQMRLVAQLRASVAELGRKEIKFVLVDADGKELLNAGGLIEIKRASEGVDGTARLHFAMNNVQFPDYGAYSLHIIADGNELHRIGFAVVKPPSTN